MPRFAANLAYLFIERPLLKLVRSWLPKGRTSRLAPAAAKA